MKTITNVLKILLLFVLAAAVVIQLIVLPG